MPDCSYLRQSTNRRLNTTTVFKCCCQAADSVGCLLSFWRQSQIVTTGTGCPTNSGRMVVELLDSLPPESGVRSMWFCFEKCGLRLLSLGLLICVFGCQSEQTCPPYVGTPVRTTQYVPCQPQCSGHPDPLSASPAITSQESSIAETDNALQREYFPPPAIVSRPIARDRKDAAPSSSVSAPAPDAIEPEIPLPPL